VACCGGIESHLEATKEAVNRWLEHESPSSKIEGLDLLFQSMESPDKPEQPQTLQILRESRRFNVPIFSQSLFDWPYIARLELNVCIDVENEYQRRKNVNQANQTKK